MLGIRAGIHTIRRDWSSSSISSDALKDFISHAALVASRAQHSPSSVSLGIEDAAVLVSAWCRSLAPSTARGWLIDLAPLCGLQCDAAMEPFSGKSPDALAILRLLGATVGSIESASVLIEWAVAVCLESEASEQPDASAQCCAWLATLAEQPPPQRDSSGFKVLLLCFVVLTSCR